MGPLVSLRVTVTVVIVTIVALKPFSYIFGFVGLDSTYLPCLIRDKSGPSCLSILLMTLPFRLMNVALRIMGFGVCHID